MSARTMLRVQELSAGYGGRRIVENVSLHVAPGEVVAVIGHNGAGKSTVLKALFNLLPDRAGTVELEGRDLGGMAPDRILSAGIAYVPQNRSVFPRLTVDENLKMGGFLLKDAETLRERTSKAKQLFPVLAERATQLAGTLSGGEQRMVEIGRALVMEPRLVMLDEPSIGLAPRMVDAVFDAVRRLRDAGKGVLMVEQNVKKALLCADRGYVMELGAIRLEAPAASLIGDERVTRLYMGRR